MNETPIVRDEYVNCPQCRARVKARTTVYSDTTYYRCCRGHSFSHPTGGFTRPDRADNAPKGWNR